MNCQRHRNTLIDIAATGAEPRAELRDHLQACPSCRKAFERERILFASIDAGVRSYANAEIPSSFLTGVHTLIPGASDLPRIWEIAPRTVFAIAAAAILLFYVGENGRPRKNEQDGNAHRSLKIESAVARTPYVGYTPYSFSPTIGLLSGEKRGDSTKESYRRKLRPKRRDSEIIVPLDQETLLLCYADQLQRRNLVPLIVDGTDQSQTEPLQVELIQIAQLEVKPLAESQW